MIEMKVLCEQFDPSKFDLKWTRLLSSDQMTLNDSWISYFLLDPPISKSNFMIPEKPIKPVICEGVEGFERVEIADGEWICLHL